MNLTFFFQSGLFLGSVFCIIFLLLTGYLATFSPTSGVFYYLSRYSYLKYAFDTMLYVIYHDYIIKLMRQTFQIYGELGLANKQYIFLKGMTNENRYYRGLIVLFCFMILLYQVNFFSLRYKIRNLRVKYGNSVFEEFIWNRFFWCVGRTGIRYICYIFIMYPLLMVSIEIYIDKRCNGCLRSARVLLVE